MSVEEMIAELEGLDAADRLRVQAALDRLEARATAADSDPVRYQQGLAAWQSLMDGFGSAGGKCLSEGIDEALYGGDR